MHVFMCVYVCVGVYANVHMFMYENLLTIMGCLCSKMSYEMRDSHQMISPFLFYNKLYMKINLS